MSFCGAGILFYSGSFIKLSPAPLRQAQGARVTENSEKRVLFDLFRLLKRPRRAGVPMEIHRDVWEVLEVENKPAYSRRQALPIKLLSDPAYTYFNLS